MYKWAPRVAALALPFSAGLLYLFPLLAAAETDQSFYQTLSQGERAERKADRALVKRPRAPEAARGAKGFVAGRSEPDPFPIEKHRL